MSSGKFGMRMRVNNEKETLIDVEKNLYGRGKQSHYETTFSVSKDKAPINFDLQLTNKAILWQKVSYELKLIRTGDYESEENKDNLDQVFIESSFIYQIDVLD